MNTDLNNQLVIVIGGTSGMGLAIARLAVSRGASVIVASRTPDKVAAVAAELGSVGKPIDTLDEASVREFFASVGSVDHLVVTGSSVRTGTLKEAPLADGEFTFRSKFFGPYLCARYAQMKSTGSITLFPAYFPVAPAITMPCWQGSTLPWRRWAEHWLVIWLRCGSTQFLRA